MNKNKPKFCVPMQLWRCEARKEFGSSQKLSWQSPADLCSAEIFIDKIFGDLTHHELIPLNPDLLMLKCHRCKLMKRLSLDACNAHSGIIWGILESVFQVNFKVNLPKYSGNICTIEFKLDT